MFDKATAGMESKTIGYAEPSTPPRVRDGPVSWRYPIILVIALIVFALAGGWWYGLNSMRGHIALEFQSRYKIQLQPGDWLVSARPTMGIDRDEYYYFKLTPGTFQTLMLRATSRQDPQAKWKIARWPWTVPEDAQIFEWEHNGFGESFMFSPSRHALFYYAWSS